MEITFSENDVVSLHKCMTLSFGNRAQLWEKDSSVTEIKLFSLMSLLN